MKLVNNFDVTCFQMERVAQIHAPLPDHKSGHDRTFD